MTSPRDLNDISPIKALAEKIVRIMAMNIDIAKGFAEIESLLRAHDDERDNELIERCACIAEEEQWIARAHAGRRDK